MSRLPKAPRGTSRKVGADPFEGFDALMQEAGIGADPSAPEATPAQPSPAARAAASTPRSGPAACPWLGLARDPDTHFSAPDAAHLCYGGGLDSHIPSAYQQEHCLGLGHASCAIFVGVQNGLKPSAPWAERRAGGLKGLLQRLFGRR